MNECDNSSGTIDFRIAVMAKLSTLEKGQESLVSGQEEICNKLDKANGNIGELFAKAAEGKVALLDHIIDCPQKEVLEKMRLRLELLDKEIALGTHPGSRDVKSRIENIERIIERYEATKKLSRWLVTLAWPILSAAGGALIMYVVEVSRKLPLK